jgi:hypothetical protein
MATTMHDETVEGVVRQLREDLSIPVEHIAKLTFIMPLYVGRLEIEKREGFLTTLLDTGATSIPEVNNAVEIFYEEMIRPASQRIGSE